MEKMKQLTKAILALSEARSSPIKVIDKKRATSIAEPPEYKPEEQSTAYVSGVGDGGPEEEGEGETEEEEEK